MDSAAAQRDEARDSLRRRIEHVRSRLEAFRTRAAGVRPDERQLLDEVQEELAGALAELEGAQRQVDIDDVARRAAADEFVHEQIARLAAELASATLEQRIAESTAKLAQANAALVAENAERTRVETARNDLRRRLDSAEDDERRRLSRELHDQLGQLLTGLILELKALAARNAPTVPEDLRLLQRLAERIAAEVQHVALELRPPALERLGAEAALKAYLEDWGNRYRVSTDFHFNGRHGQRLGTELENTLFRVIQEALSNVARHAHATHVSVVIDARGGSASLIIEDDGTGFDSESSLDRFGSGKRLGLLGMRERVELLGGTLDVESSADSGTTIFVRIPFEVPSDEGQVK